MIIDFKHLRSSMTASKHKHSSLVHGYCWHWAFAMKEAVLLIWLGVLSIAHAFLPFLFGWSLLERHVNMLKYTKTKVPGNKTMRKVTFKE